MKKRLIFAIAMLALIAFTFAACSESTQNDPVPTSAQETETTETESTAPAAEDVKAQMAGNWIWYEHNPYNAALMNLSPDGSWESPGPLPSDMTIGGSFVVAREESGMHYLRFTIEHTSDHPASEYIEIGSEWDWVTYMYDAENDRLGMEIPAEGYSGEMQIVWFVRQ